MKASTESWGDDPADALLFDYLEGNLSEASAKDLEERLATDPGLRMELELWKEAFVEPEFYDTQLLEESLLQQPVKVAHISTSAFIAVLLTALLSFLPLAQQQERVPSSRPVKLPASVSSTDKKAPARPTQKPTLSKKLLPEASSHNSTPEQVIQWRTSAEKLNGAELLQPKALPQAVISPASGLSALEVKMNRIGFKKTPVARIITRKQQRKLERMKEKARQERAANQFLKGRVPYVVPLNTNNF